MMKVKTVCPDVGIKSSPNFPKDAQKVATTQHLLRRDVFKNSRKITKNLGDFCNNFLPNAFKKCLIWSHWTNKVYRSVVFAILSFPV